MLSSSTAVWSLAQQAQLEPEKIPSDANDAPQPAFLLLAAVEQLAPRRASGQLTSSDASVICASAMPRLQEPNGLEIPKKQEARSKLLK